jgi:hypothetical protein
LLTSCHSAPLIQKRFDAPREKLVSAIRSELPNVKQEGDVFETYWHADPAVAASWKRGGSVLASESRFRVTVLAEYVNVEARSRVFVWRGARRKDWEEVDPAPAAARLLERIEARLK